MERQYCVCESEGERGCLLKLSAKKVLFLLFLHQRSKLWRISPCLGPGWRLARRQSRLSAKSYLAAKIQKCLKWPLRKRPPTSITFHIYDISISHCRPQVLNHLTTTTTNRLTYFESKASQGLVSNQNKFSATITTN